MTDRSPVVVRLVRTDVKRLRLGQFLAALCMAAGPIARRVMNGPVLAVAGGLMTYTFIVLLTARRSFGKVSVNVHAGRLHLHDVQAAIRHAEVTAWTISGASARVYTPAAGWRFKVRREEGDALRAVLTEAFGAPLALERRGTRRGRVIAAVVMLVGIAVVALAIALHVPALIVVGVPSAIFGFAALATLSQKDPAGAAGQSRRRRTG